MKRIIYVSHDQLNAKYGALKGANPKEDLIVLVESARMVSSEFGSKVRLYFLLSFAVIPYQLWVITASYLSTTYARLN